MLASRAVFDCGQPALNQYLVQTALQHEKRNVTRTFCLLQGDGIAGFYSLTNAIVNVGELTADLIRHYRLPTHVLPVVRLARLGIDVRHQRQGLGRLLLVDALRKVIAVAESSGCVGLLVDAQDENARLFYTAFGFRAAPENPLLLFMPLPDIQELFREV
ncbi:acetyltransferase [Isoalcanivorax pacificus W11-5]|uniref:Acetyltransferase n=1 Tax=Isoalcanivorax pacificus W11-5 TaxID=391936 RepID=A0A0B4XQN4_9GAMM|nr:GNAT family N-acetyltransferase [Isoalcanivorax pacificus]AJD48547.1 acetyltransferase [Isoalcanivorax pacificus W11-5]